MVKLHVKQGDESQFLYETSVSETIDSVLDELLEIFNGRRRLDKLCCEMEQLAKHGLCLPPKMQGLTEEQITELKLKDEWADKCIPPGGVMDNKDPVGKRNGLAPNEKSAEVIQKCVAEAKERMSKKQVDANINLTKNVVKDMYDMLKGAIMIVYPMGLPPHESVQEMLECFGSLSYEQDELDPASTHLWWAGKQLIRGKKLLDFVGKNEKTKVIVKLQKASHGPPGREPIFSEEQKKEMMLNAYRRQEELKKLEGDEDDSYLQSNWADNRSLQRAFQGLNNINFKPK